MRTLFFTVYDYGQGDAWALIHADSEEQIRSKFPMLEILPGRPDWMDDAFYEELLSRDAFDIDEQPPEWVELALAEYRPGKPPSRRAQ